MEKRLCRACSKELNPKQKYYCSNDCKLKDPAGIAIRTKPKEKQDSSKLIRCKITGKTFKDISNYSGVLTRHIETLNRPTDDIFSNFEIIDNPDFYKPKYHCKYCEWTTKDINNKSGCITVHLKDIHDISPTQHIENHPEEEGIWKYTHSSELRDHFLSKDIDSYVVCLECDEKLKYITQTHLINKHGMTIEEYRNKHGKDTIYSKDYYQTLLDNRKEFFYPKMKTFVSKAESEIAEYIKSLGVDVEISNKTIVNPFEIDIFLPQYNIAIEHDGLYWHSEFSQNKLKDYHLKKTERCEQKGIHLIHIFEDEWVDKKEIVKSRISAYLNIRTKTYYARKCTVMEIDYATKSNFLKQNHLQGDDISRYYFGMFYKDTLVAVMTFSKPRVALGVKKSIEGHYELSRFATDGKVLGGASRLLHYFIMSYNPKKIITYADRRWTPLFKPSMYEKIGFTKIGTSDPSYWYIEKYQIRHHRFKYTKFHIVEKLGGDRNLTEVENMRRMGYDRIWDCGTVKYELVLTS